MPRNNEKSKQNSKIGKIEAGKTSKNGSFAVFPHRKLDIRKYVSSSKLKSLQ